MEIINADVVSKYLVLLFKRTGLNFETVAEKSEASVATIKNMYYGKSENPGILTIHRVITVMGGSFTEMFNQDKQEDLQEFSISSIKEMYEYQLAENAKMCETHINNIRAHYEQHREDFKENVEHRLADKREIIAQQTEQIKSLKKEILSTKIFSWICVAVLVVLLIAEVMNPNLGWLRY